MSARASWLAPSSRIQKLLVSASKSNYFRHSDKIGENIAPSARGAVRLPVGDGPAPDFRAPRDKLHRLCEDGEIVQVKRGLYISGTTGRRLDGGSRVLSGLVYGPSYVSLETALTHHG